MRAILIPVKDFSQAKQRLTSYLPDQDRISLVQAMLEDVFSVVARLQAIDKVFVVSSNAQVLERARTLGWETIRESRQISESNSVDAASRYCAACGIDALLRLPVDVPLIEPDDVDVILQESFHAPAMVIVPSRDGTGTNALLRTPPDLFPSHFGPNSFSKHLGEAERRGAAIRILRNSRLELDVDDLADLQSLSATQIGPHTGAWLAVHGFAATAKKERTRLTEPTSAARSRGRP